MTLKELQPLIIEWAKEKDLIKLNNAPKQRLKLIEEAGELANAILKSDVDDQKDAIGDMFVVLVILAEQVKCEMLFPGDKTLFKLDNKNTYDSISQICAFVEYPETEILYLYVLSKSLGLDLTECANIAWNEIKDRTGKTVNGTFIKAE